VLNAGRARSELALFDGKGPAALRVLPWGADNLVAANGALKSGLGEKLYLGGVSGGEVRPLVSVPVELFNLEQSLGASAANLGAKRLLQKGEEPVWLGSDVKEVPRTAPNKWKWAVLAGVLAMAALTLRYAESGIYRSRLNRKLAAISDYRRTLPQLEKEFAFLHYIKTNQPPYLDTLAVLASAAPPGTKIESLSLLRHGDLSLRGSTGDAQAPGTFRSKLIDSGFFSRVVVEEQAPVQDGQKFNFRISAQLKADGDRKPFALPATRQAAANSPARK
jgi:hypothetical protein